MKFVTTLERDECGVWVVECPSIPGCVSQGETREEALSNICEAIAACVEVRDKLGLSLRPFAPRGQRSDCHSG